MPEGAHKCVQCHKDVHPLDGCSIAVEGEEEGYGQGRLCMECSTKNRTIISHNVDVIDNSLEEIPVPIDQRRKQEKNKKIIDISNGKTKPLHYLAEERNKHRPCSKYHGKRAADVRDAIEFDKGKPVSVIRNGNQEDLAIQQVHGKETVLRNTCAFDSLTYLGLFAVHDFPNIKQKVILSRNYSILIGFQIPRFISHILKNCID